MRVPGNRELKRVSLDEIKDLPIDEQLKVGSEGVYAGEYMRRDYPYMEDIGADSRLNGFPSGLSPFSNKTSASRESMYSSHLAQSVVINGSELPRIFTGEERNLADYTINSTRRDEDVEIIDVIPKYAKVSSGVMGAKELNFWTVIYRGVDSREVSYFNLQRYENRSGEWGYENQLFEKNIQHYLQKGQFLSKDTKIAESPDFKGSRYCTGTNLNTVYMTTAEVLEDAMVISETAAEKLKSTGMDVINMFIHPNYIPINLYSEDDDSPKFFPDVGERVRDDGVVAAFRKVNIERFAGDVCHQNITRVDPANDIILRAPAGAKIVDVDFYVNRNRREDTFPQIKPYQANLTEYYRRIMDNYKNHQSSALSERFLSLVNKAIISLVALGENPPGIGKVKNSAVTEGIDDKPVEFIHGRITYFHEIPATVGGKLSDRQGSKGVIAAVRPDHEMPVDEYGIRADLIMDPASPVKRVNAGQFFEQGINRISEFVRREVEKAHQDGDTEKAFKIALEWYKDVHPSYAALIVDKVLTTPEKRAEHVRDIIKEGFYLWVQSFLTTMTKENINHWFKKWKCKKSPVTFTIDDYWGKPKVFKTQKDMLIGEKYIVRLCKDPIPTSPGVSTVSHHGIPIAPPKITRYSTLIRLKPARLGEDEYRVLMMDVPSPEVTRLKRIGGQSPAGSKAAIQEILTNPHPTRIGRINMSNERLKETDVITSQDHHLNAVAGINTYKTLVEKRVEPLKHLERPMAPKKRGRKPKVKEESSDAES